MVAKTQTSNPLKSVEINGENYFKIENSDRLRPFFMSIVSAYNHWMFIGSNGGLTAGRKNNEYSLFPYYSDDKVLESTENTGPKTIVQLTINNKVVNWEPFQEKGNEKFSITRNLYKSRYGNKIIFEEINHNLNLAFKYEWCSSNKYGFVRTSTITNVGNEKRTLRVLDGMQNLLPHGAGADLQMRQSNLIDAYKRNELDEASGMGIFALSAIIVDRAEPSEALKANVAWQAGIENPKYLVSSMQLSSFISGNSISQENDVKAEKGAYFIETTLDLNSADSKNWLMATDVNKSHSAVAEIAEDITSDGIIDRVYADIDDCNQELIKLTAASDGLQHTADTLKDTRHFANVMFNIMRGGIFDNNYQIEKWDIVKYLKSASEKVYENNKALLDKLSAEFTVMELQDVVNESSDPSFVRLLSEYLPLKFSRRHGDPSRPWNAFSINTRSEEDGSKILDYQGNWRDIFQNWEALAFAYPEFMEGMIYRFLNASTFDGYNPYRIMKHGFDWEIIEPDDPWSYIGYWGDHQIIYLLKFLEFFENHKPGKLEELFTKDIFAYAAVPYRIKDYQDILKNPKDTIEFDHAWDAQIRKNRESEGGDGALLKNSNGDIYHVNFIEKILATTLAKISNLVPEAGIWMNTQRPEWNDANNALVGNGVSMVTLYYLRRFLAFFNKVLENSNDTEVEISKELYDCYTSINEALIALKDKTDNSFNDADRKDLMDKLGTAAATFRNRIYNSGFSGNKSTLSLSELDAFYRLSNAYMEQSIRANERPDHLYHAYNIIDIKETSVSVSYLDEMLEGQVAALSSGYLSAEQSLALMDALRTSSIYREDQNSYILYPNKELLGFLQRNQIPADLVAQSELFTQLITDGNGLIIEKDVKGAYHFNGAIRNGFELDKALAKLDTNKYGSLIEKDRDFAQEIYEKVFNHKTFTGRSGTFYGYEGLGSIYWHMVSKLLLAIEENTVAAADSGQNPETVKALTEHCYEVFEGIGVHKSPDVYGAYSIDPYSHTPYTKGAQQPGMTGQVKEDIISRTIELGVQIDQGQIRFSPSILNRAEFISAPTTFKYVDVNGEFKTVDCASDSIAYTYCQVPVIYTLSDTPSLTVYHTNGKLEELDGATCTKEISEALFARNGQIEKIEVGLVY
ncbi:MAG: hypothetical protein JXQ87_07990 [Bacteroidia bacterium]